ncbi:hypothetical protein PENTCL1PPCAC_16335, partial [Pristionchus entomophagus]
QRSELAWIANRGGILQIFGDFGQPEQIKNELVFLIIGIATHAPFVIALSLHSINSLKEYKKNLVSSRTLRMTDQMLDVFNCQVRYWLVKSIKALFS